MAKLRGMLFIFIMCLSMGCMTSNPSICDQLTEPSYLCEMVAGMDVTLEEVGAVLIVENAIAIGAGAYSKEDAVVVLKELRDLLENPISYRFFRAKIKKAMDYNPALFAVASVYLDMFGNPKIMHNVDRAMLRSWLNARIRDLEPERNAPEMSGTAAL